MFRRLAAFFELVKFQHTLFALPFAVLAAARAAGGVPAGWQIGWLLAAMVTARSAAMAFNRIVDRRYDAANPRTADRPLPRGALSTAAAAVFTLVMVAGFVLSAAMLNLACLYLTPVALVVVLGYSYAKRFTALSHAWLGLSLAIAPAGAWVGVRGALDEPYPFLLAAAVVFWTAGFDIIYACLDVAFDRSTGLRSIPARIGVKPALRVSAALHALFAATLVALGVVEGSGWIWWAGTGVVAALLVYEHAIVKFDDLKRVNEAFFRVNAVVSAIVMGAGLAGLDALPTLCVANTQPLDVCFVEQRLTLLPAGADWYVDDVSLRPFYERLDIRFCPDGRRVAYPFARSGIKAGWILDGERKRLISDVRDFQFSSNGRRYWYIVERALPHVSFGMDTGPFGFPWCRIDYSWGADLIVDHRRICHYANSNNVVFSPDSAHVAYIGVVKRGPNERPKYDVVIDGIARRAELPTLDDGCPHPIYFSPDGRRTAYHVQDNNKTYLVVDGVRREEATVGYGFSFSPDSRDLAYAFAEDGRYYVMVKGVREGPYSHYVAPVVFSRDGHTVGYAACVGEDWFSVVNGVRRRVAENQLSVHLFLSPDGTRTACVVDREYVVVDGQRADDLQFEGDIWPVVFSPDSRRMAYAVSGHEHGSTRDEVVVLDGRKGEPFDYCPYLYPVIRFSPDSRHLAYVAYREGQGCFVVLDGAIGEPLDWIAPGTMTFSPDSRKLAYGARKGRELWWKVVDVK